MGLRSPAPTSIRPTGIIDATYADGRFTAKSANPIGDIKFRDLKFQNPNRPRWREYDIGATTLH